MLVNHRKTTWPHRLAILSSFPPTTGPFEYKYVEVIGTFV